MTPLEQFPADDAPLSEWLRPLSALTTPARCRDDTRGGFPMRAPVPASPPKLAGEMTEGEQRRIVRARHDEGKTLSTAARLIGKSYDQTRKLAGKMGLQPWGRR